VSPSTAILDINACMQVNIDFTPSKTGDHTGELVLRYNTGEEVYTRLYGSARDTNVRLDRSSITMEDTFIGLSSQRSVVLHNRSDVVVHFEWKAFASKMEEEMQKEM
jgi:hydrocephalus-inducing protein